MRASMSKGYPCLLFAITCLLLLVFVSPPPATAAPLDNWHARDSKTTSDLYNVVWGGDRFVTVGRAGSILASPDGVTWTLRSSGTNSWLYGVTYGNNKFVAAGQSGTIIVSQDGLSWSARSSGTTSQLFSIAFGDNTFVIVGDSGTIVTSADSGNNWTVVSSDPGIGGLFGVAYGNGQFVVVGESGTILTSPDGFNWAERSSGATEWWFDAVAFGNSQYVAPGGNNGSGPIAIIASSNGSNWTRTALLTPGDFYSIGFGGGDFVAVGAQGKILTSSDGVNWTARPPETQNSLRGVAFDGTTFIVTGWDGTILQSDPVSGPPVAEAGPPQTVAAGTLVTLDGSGSYDPEGGAITYAWQFTTRPSGSLAAFTDPALANPTFTADLRGEYKIDLLVTDSARLESQPDEVIVTAGNRPASNAGQNQSFVKVGTPITLDGRGSSSPDGLTITYEWQIISKPSNSMPSLANPASATPTFIPDMRGAYRISLVVTDSLGLQSQPSQVTVTAGTRPVANAGNDQSVIMGAQVTLDGSASSSPDQAYPLSYAWQFESRPGGEAILQNLTTARPTFTADATGPYSISLVVTDPAGFQSLLAKVTVTANNPPSPAPPPEPAPVPIPEPAPAPAPVPAPASQSGGDGGGGGCFIATSLYGDPMAPEVMALKQFRDAYLLTNPLGRYVVAVYYKFSPSVAERLEGHEVLRTMGRTILTPLVWTLNRPLAPAFILLGLTALVVLRKIRRRS